ncbi:DUF5708 family protein [Spirillospora sp. NPDC050679]
MNAALKTILAGSATLVVGLGLWLWGSDSDIAGFTPSKVGVVLIVLGIAEACYGVYKYAAGGRREPR